MADAYDLVNRGLNGKLEERLAELRAEGKSIEDITEQFADEGYPVSRETIRRWLKRLGLPTRLEKAS